MPPMYSLHLRFFDCRTPMPPSLIGRLMRFCMKGDRVAFVIRICVVRVIYLINNEAKIF